ncbi:MAG: ABC transporter permease [Planctomycetes bacterium]|nr:ABC transporter permease [Planctomycetota bacterium]
MPPPDSTTTPARCTFEREGDRLILRCGGSWSLHAEHPRFAEQTGALAGDVARLEIEGREIQRWDSSLLAFLHQLAHACREKEIELDPRGLPEGAQRLLALSLEVEERGGARRVATRSNPLAAIGGGVLGAQQATMRALAFLGDVVISLFRFATFRARFRRADLWTQLHATGAGALGIVALINVLVGLILAFVGSMQLRMFGAEIYVASLVGIAIVRVMGPIMTGIILAGRTGAAFAAQIGTMQVNEEVDALETMGLPPSEYLVLPRVLSLAIMTPLLCLYADLLGILGGLIVGVAMLGIGPRQYLTQTFESVGLDELWIGLLHGAVFGIWIALAGCYHGMRCGRSASAVGQAVTAAVVSGIIGIVVMTAILTVVFDTLGL